MSTKTPLSSSWNSFGVPFRRISVHEYHRMNDAGILRSGEPFELIEGLIVFKDRSATGEDRMTVGREHIWSVKALGRLDERLRPLGCHMQTQSPVVLSNLDEPEPDGAVLRGGMDDYKTRKPTAGDVLCVFEVADSSLDYDRTEKQALYADSEIDLYVILNLPDRAIEVFSEPLKGKGRYAKSETLRPGERLKLPVGGGKTLSVPVRKLLP